MYFIPKGGDGQSIDKAEPMPIGSLVNIRIPESDARKFECLNPCTGVIMGISPQAVHIQLLPDKHPEIAIPYKQLGDENNYFQILDLGPIVQSASQYRRLNDNAKTIEKSSQELAELLLNDAESLIHWHEYIYGAHKKGNFSELTKATETWVRGFSWCNPQEKFHWPHIIGCLLAAFYGLDYSS